MATVADAIRAAGIVGAGGAGFPTHVKAQGRAQIVLANGAECEPLLRVDRQMMAKYPERIVRGLQAMVESVGAGEGVLCVKKKYHEAAEALQNAIRGEKNLRVFLLDNYYPAGDEQQIVFEVTGKVVPTGGIPLDVGAVVCNVTTLMQIADALEGKPVTERYLTVTGEVANPMTLKAPIGTPFSALIAAAGGPERPEGYALIVGGPAMGKLCCNWDDPVQKTTGGLVVLPSNHPLIRMKTENPETEIMLTKAACCQCNLCTQMCPRNALGLGVEPHKIMRAAFTGRGNLMGEPNGVFSCCDCGLCTYFACNFGLKPSRMMARMKSGLASSGVKPEKRVKNAPAPFITKVPTARLVGRMGVAKYDVDAPLSETTVKTKTLNLPLRMHIGAPSIPIVRVGERVTAGQLLAEIPEGKLGARVHASASGTVSGITQDRIELTTT